MESAPRLIGEVEHHEPDPITQLGDELEIRGQLEVGRPVRLEAVARQSRAIVVRWIPTARAINRPSVLPSGNASSKIFRMTSAFCSASSR